MKRFFRKIKRNLHLAAGPFWCCFGLHEWITLQRSAFGHKPIKVCYHCSSIKDT